MFNGQRYKTLKSGYKLDRLIFTVGMYLLFTFFFYLIYNSNVSISSDLNYYSCSAPPPGEELCRNPFYKPPTWVNSEYVPPGEYGNKPGLLFNSIKFVTVAVFILMFLINHVIYNKGKNPFKGLKIEEV